MAKMDMGIDYLEKDKKNEAENKIKEYAPALEGCFSLMKDLPASIFTLVPSTLNRRVKAQVIQKMALIHGVSCGTIERFLGGALSDPDLSHIFDQLIPFLQRASVVEKTGQKEGKRNVDESKEVKSDEETQEIQSHLIQAIIDKFAKRPQLLRDVRVGDRLF
jgi:hypothetical protein